MKPPAARIARRARPRALGRQLRQRRGCRGRRGRRRQRRRQRQDWNCSAPTHLPQRLGPPRGGSRGLPSGGPPLLLPNGNQADPSVVVRLGDVVERRASEPVLDPQRRLVPVHEQLRDGQVRAGEPSGLVQGGLALPVRDHGPCAGLEEEADDLGTTQAGGPVEKLQKAGKKEARGTAGEHVENAADCPPFTPHPNCPDSDVPCTRSCPARSGRGPARGEPSDPPHPPRRGRGRTCHSLPPSSPPRSGGRTSPGRRGTRGPGCDSSASRGGAAGEGRGGANTGGNSTEM